MSAVADGPVWKLGHGCLPISIITRRWTDLAPKNAVVDRSVEEHQREDEKTFSPKHERETGLRRRRFLDGQDEGDHVRPEREGHCAKGAQEDHCDHEKGHFIPTISNA